MEQTIFKRSAFLYSLAIAFALMLTPSESLVAAPIGKKVVKKGFRYGNYKRRKPCPCHKKPFQEQEVFDDEYEIPASEIPAQKQEMPVRPKVEKKPILPVEFDDQEEQQGETVGHHEKGETVRGAQEAEPQAISVKGDMQLHINVGEAFNIEMDGTEADKAFLKASIQEGTIVIESSGLINKGVFPRWESRLCIHDQCVTRTCTKGVCNPLTSSRLHADSLENTLKNMARETARTQKGATLSLTIPVLSKLTVSGKSDVSVKNLAGEEFTVNHNGTGNIELKGRVEKANIKTEGAGRINASELVTSHCKVEVLGTGVTHVYAERELSMHVDGPGTIYYHGSPSDVVKNAPDGAAVRAGE